MTLESLSSDETRLSRVTAADLIASALRRHGVEVMFSQSLPSAVVLACEDAGIRQITYRTENAGGAMADGYARRSNRIAVVCAQNGPAATLLVAPLAEASKSSIPIVALVQEVNRSQVDRNAFQELDHMALFQACAKWVRRVGEAGRVEDYVDMAFAAAGTGRPGPAVLLLPADLLIEQVAEPQSARSARLGQWPLDRAVADPDLIGRAADLLADARSPLVIAGGGVHGAQATAELAELQELASLPVATTVMGKGAVDDGHPLSVGPVGNIMGNRSLGRFTRPLVGEADVVLLVGTRTNQNGTDSWTLLPAGARIIHLDVDGQEVGRIHEALRLVGDAKLTLAGLASALRTRDLGRRRGARPALAERIADARAQRMAAASDVCGSQARPIRPERVMQEIEHVLAPEMTVVADASYSSVWVTAYLASRAPGMRFLTPRGLAGLGWGLPLAVGAKLARPDGPVICVVGDGGFGHVWSELETLVRESIPIVLVVLNNGVLGYQKDAETVKFGRHTNACHFQAVDHAAIARACNCDAVRIDAPDAIEPALRAAIARPRATLLDIVTDPDAYPPLTMFDGQLKDPADKHSA